jgi:hypothetical protein
MHRRIVVAVSGAALLLALAGGTVAAGTQASTGSRTPRARIRR